MFSEGVVGKALPHYRSTEAYAYLHSNKISEVLFRIYVSDGSSNVEPGCQSRETYGVGTAEGEWSRGDSRLLMHCRVWEVN